MVDQPRVCFVSASGQNVLVAELLAAFREELEEVCGLSTTAAVDHVPPIEDDLVYVLVPHEYAPAADPQVSTTFYRPSESMSKRPWRGHRASQIAPSG